MIRLKAFRASSTGLTGWMVGRGKSPTVKNRFVYNKNDSCCCSYASRRVALLYCSSSVIYYIVWTLNCIIMVATCCCYCYGLLRIRNKSGTRRATTRALWGESLSITAAANPDRFQETLSAPIESHQPVSRARPSRCAIYARRSQLVFPTTTKITTFRLHLV